MQKRNAACFGILAAAAALAGCGTRYERSISSRPGGGIVRIIAKPSQIVFPAALRVMHDTGEEIWEADQKAGRIVSISALGQRAIFSPPFPMAGPGSKSPPTYPVPSSEGVSSGRAIFLFCCENRSSPTRRRRHSENQNSKKEKSMPTFERNSSRK
ncbi:MAG TPA: hypothetical protein DDZ83_04910 [Nitrospinae bacterium]|nr:hypothetical protein [Nitrospinota bacterium]